MQLTISGYSTALFATWYFIEELGLLFDAGEGITSSLLQKSRKINHVFVSHADRDHLTGLLQFNQLNAREGFPIIYYPKDSGSFIALENFTKKFDPHVSGTIWKQVTPQDEVFIKNDILVKPIRNGHIVASENIIKSLSYKAIQTKTKVKPEIAKLPPDEIKRIIAEQGKENTTQETRTNILSYSGDTPVEDLERWKDSKILIHEATFFGGEEEVKISPHANKHSTLEDVMRMVSNLNIETLILGHFSSRYSNEQIDLKIKKLCDKYAINIPVHRVLPGQVSMNILSQEPINK